MLFQGWGKIMIGSPMKTGVVVAMGLVLLVGQGCSMKGLQSDGETGAGSPQNGANRNFPGMAPGGSGKGLSGFSQNPSEERLGKSGDIASLPSSGMSARQRPETTKEEKAAIEAGLQDVFFGYDQWSLSGAGMEALNGDAQWLKDHPGTVMKVEGHCDERGTADYNIVLGDKRAKAARSYLIESGVAPKQLAIVSYGKARPFCTEPDESCYQQNRRGHVLLNMKN
jgi:peptidoglycan-associated lipoprotein